jgi:type IV secretory pathway VirJ component
MQQARFIIIIFFIAFNSIICNSQENITYGSFGKINIYKPQQTPVSFVILISSTDGFNKNMNILANAIAKQNVLVAGLDFNVYMKALKSLRLKCYYPAGEFEQISMMLQKKYKLKQYHKPILVGYSAGSTLAYGLLAQAPANTFKGVIALSYNPVLKISKPLCTGTGLKQRPMKEGKLYYFEPDENLSAPFIVLQGSNDKAFSYSAVSLYLKTIHNAQLVELNGLSHDYAITENCLPQFDEALKKIKQIPSFVEQKNAQNKLLESQHLSPLSDEMPLALLPTSIKNDSLPMVFFISGDGGWSSFDNSVAESFAEKGLPVVGLDAQKYFWDEKKPEEATLEVSRAIEHYMQQWNKKKFILVGYSFGADVMPFITNRLQEQINESLQGVFCLSPSETADFEIHIMDMMSMESTEDTYKVIDEMKKMKHLKPVCFFGEEEDAELQTKFTKAGITVNTLPGSHNFDNNANKLSFEIIKELNKITSVR